MRNVVIYVCVYIYFSIKCCSDFRLKPPECPNKEWCASSSDKAFYFPQVQNSDVDKDSVSECDKFKGVCNSKKSVLNMQQNDELYQLPTHLLPQSDTRLFIIPPGGEKNITVAFLTLYPKKVSSVLYIRSVFFFYV